MANSYAKSKSRSNKRRFAGIPHSVMKHPDYVALPPNAKVLLLELAMQYNGRNNGDLTVAWTVMRERGFKSKATLSNAKEKLLESGLIVMTRAGDFMSHKCALYALTWQGIDECPRKGLDVKPTQTPYRSFSVELAKQRAY